MSKYRSKKEQKSLCEAWKQSELTKREFCEQNGIKEHSFYRWLRKLNNKACFENANLEKAQNNTELLPFKFLPINNNNASNTIATKCFSSERGLLEIILPNGINFKISISPDNAQSFLQELLQWK